MVKRTKRGFTIVELLIATAVFSMVLLVALSGFLQTGRLFYKGVSLTQTQATAKQILDDVSTNITNTGASKIASSPPGSTYFYQCVGNVRYTYNPNVPVQLAQNQTLAAGGNFGLLRDNINGCTTPCAPGGPCAQPFNNPVEMLGDNMRVSIFTIIPTANLFTINLTIAYGDNSSMNNPVAGTVPTCVGSSQNQQFCAVTSLSTSVSTGFYAPLAAAGSSGSPSSGSPSSGSPSSGSPSSGGGNSAKPTCFITPTTTGNELTNQGGDCQPVDGNGSTWSSSGTASETCLPGTDTSVCTAAGGQPRTVTCGGASGTCAFSPTSSLYTFAAGSRHAQLTINGCNANGCTSYSTGTITW